MSDDQLRLHRIYIPTTKGEIQEHVRDPNRQTVRLSMKGLPTERKLKSLLLWAEVNTAGSKTFPVVEHSVRVQISNYLNALKRGGLIDHNFNVLR